MKTRGRKREIGKRKRARKSERKKSTGNELRVRTTSGGLDGPISRIRFSIPKPETGIARVPMPAFTLNSLQARETLEATYLRLAMNRVNPVASVRTRLYLRRVSFGQSPAKIDSRPSPYLGRRARVCVHAGTFLRPCHDHSRLLSRVLASLKPS